MGIIKTQENMALAKAGEPAIEGMIRARDSSLHISAIMLLRIVDHLTYVDDYPTVAEVHGFYRGHRTSSITAKNYTYGGVSSMLRVLKARGYLLRFRNSRQITYKLSKSGESLLDGMSM